MLIESWAAFQLLRFNLENACYHLVLSNNGDLIFLLERNIETFLKQEYIFNHRIAWYLNLNKNNCEWFEMKVRCEEIMAYNYRYNFSSISIFNLLSHTINFFSNFWTNDIHFPFFNLLISILVVNSFNSLPFSKTIASCKWDRDLKNKSPLAFVVFLRFRSTKPTFFYSYNVFPILFHWINNGCIFY